CGPLARHRARAGPGHPRPAGRRGGRRRRGRRGAAVTRLSGMTGFARAEGAAAGWSWAVEARSVNGRNLEVRFRGPPGFDGLDRTVRELAQARLQRGQVTVGLQARRADGDQPPPRVNAEVLEHYLAVARDLTARGAAAPTADGLLALRGVLETAEETDDPEARAG